MPAPPPAAAAASPAAILGLTAAEEDEFYPSSDGLPMAENMWQGDAIMSAAGDIRAARPEALVASDILMYPQEGNRYNSIAPDVLVAFGIGTHKRMTYRVWREGKPPDWVLEVASHSTAKKDLTTKRDAYAEIGVRECWLFDPRGDVYPKGTERLQGFELVRGKYRPLPWEIHGGARMIRSKVLGLGVRQEDELLRFRDLATGEDIPHQTEARAAAAEAATATARAGREAARANREAARANREATARSAAEARVAQLEAELRRSRSGTSDHPP